PRTDPGGAAWAGVGAGCVPRPVAPGRAGGDDPVRGDSPASLRVQPLAAGGGRGRPPGGCRRIRSRGVFGPGASFAEAAMIAGRWSVLFLGWLALLGLLAPLLFAAWVSFSPDSFLTPPTGAWSFRWYLAFAADHRWTAALVRSLIVGGGAA